MRAGKKTLMVFAVTTILILFFQQAFAVAIPKTVHYQGYLTNTSGNPLTTTLDIQTEIFDISSGGTAVYTETHSSVSVNKGQFDLTLGAGTSSGDWATDVDFMNALWLQMTIDPTGVPETLHPRVPLLPAPYARVAMEVPDSALSDNVSLLGQTIESSEITDLTITNDIAVGINATLQNAAYNIAIGTDTRASKGNQGYGDGVGGIAIGYSATARYARPGEGANSSGWESPSAKSGIAIGGSADGDYGGIAIGHEADGQYRNISIGHKASSYSGYGRITIGNDITNRNNDSIMVRGNLFLDGAPSRTVGSVTGRIFHRDTAGTGSWTAKAFTIDHPLDPKNKVLRHYCLEGPEVWNIYAGNVRVKDGKAEVLLPDYYAKLNKTGSEIYSLTAIGGFADICVLTPSNGNRFVIAASKDIQVSWSIKVRRNDEALKRDLMLRPVEQLKSELTPGQAGAENKSVNTNSATIQ